MFRVYECVKGGGGGGTGGVRERLMVLRLVDRVLEEGGIGCGGWGGKWVCGMMGVVGFWGVGDVMRRWWRARLLLARFGKKGRG